MPEKYALVVGCNYKHTPPPTLNGCINDAKSMHGILTNRFGFKETNVELLTDKRSSKVKPTASTIKKILKQFLSRAKSGDFVLFSFAGHGTIMRAATYPWLLGKDAQAIVGSDSNFISSLDFRKILNEAPTGVDFVIVSDSCCSGGLIDKEIEQIGPNRPQTNLNIFNFVPIIMLNILDVFTTPRVVRMIPFEVLVQQLVQLAVNIPFDILNIPAFFLQLFGEDASLIFQNISFDQIELRPLRPNQGILLSGCQSNELSAETKYDGEKHGVFTAAVLDVLKKHPRPITNRELVVRAREFVGKVEDKQHPCLYCGDMNVFAYFLYKY